MNIILLTLSHPGVTSIKFLLTILNHLQIISPNGITLKLHFKVMRIKEMIAN